MMTAMANRNDSATMSLSTLGAVPKRPPASAESASERELLALLRQGDEHAYEQLVRRYGGRLLAVTRRLLRGDEEEARDAVQDAFLSAFRSIDRFNQDAAIGTWLHRIAVNAALMKRRRAGSRPEVALDPLLPTFDETAHHAEVVHTWPASAETIVMRAQTRTAVRQCIDQLPDTYRTILMLRDIEELSTTETAAALGISENAVKIRLHRARQALRTLLDPTMSVG